MLDHLLCLASKKKKKTTLKKASASVGPRSTLPEAERSDSYEETHRIKVDWKETASAHVFEVDIPGSKEDVNVQIENGKVLQIGGEWKWKTKEERTIFWHLYGWSCLGGEWVRRFRLPEDANLDLNNVNAAIEDGLLTLTLPKASVGRPYLSLPEADQVSNFRHPDSDKIMVDWRETASAHVFTVQLPGLKKESVKMEIENGEVVQIGGEWKCKEKEEGVKWHRSERTWGKFMRRFRLPEDAILDLKNVNSVMEDGLLTVTLPKVVKPIISVKISG